MKTLRPLLVLLLCAATVLAIGAAKIPEAVEAAKEGVVELEVWGIGSISGKLERYRASGVVIKRSGVILTCGHLFWRDDDPADSLVLLTLVVIAGGKVYSLGDLDRTPGPNPLVDADRDLALIKLDAQLRSGLGLGEVKVADKVWALGYDEPGELIIIPGEVIDVAEDEIRISLEVLPPFGMSGGPVLNSKGEVIGIAIARREVDTLLIASPSAPTVVRELYSRMMRPQE